MTTEEDCTGELPRERARIRSIAVRTTELSRNLDLFLAFAVAGVLGNRFFLVLTGYPQVGNGTLHISHAIWGGLMMVLAIGAALSYIAPGVRVFVAIVGGAGLGWFVDELGKFITRDVNYFFRPTLALIYIVFIGMYLASRSVRRRRFDADEGLLNALEAVKAAAIGRLDEPTRREALALGLQLMIAAGEIDRQQHPCRHDANDEHHNEYFYQREAGRGTRSSHGCGRSSPRKLLLFVPISDVGVDAFTARLPIGAQGKQVVVVSVSSGEDVLVLIAPGVLAHVLDVAAGSPVMDGRIGRLHRKCLQALIRTWVLGIVEPEHGERGLKPLNVLLRLRDTRFVDSIDDLRHDDGRQEPDDDHDDHNLDQS